MKKKKKKKELPNAPSYHHHFQYAHFYFRGKKNSEERGWKLEQELRVAFKDTSDPVTKT